MYEKTTLLLHNSNSTIVSNHKIWRHKFNKSEVTVLYPFQIRLIPEDKLKHHTSSGTYSMNEEGCEMFLFWGVP